MKKDLNNKEEELESLIGKEVEVFVNETETKKVTVINVRKIKDEYVIVDESGVPYGEDEINWSYRLTPAIILYETLTESGILDPKKVNFNGEKFESVFSLLIENLIKQGYIAQNEEKK